MSYKLLLKIKQPGDAHGSYGDQPSPMCAVEIDNSLPRTLQVLKIVAYSVREEQDDTEAWSLSHIDDRCSSAIGLINSALPTVERVSLVPK